MAEKNKRSWVKKLLVAGLILLVAGGALAWYLFNLTYDDTAGIKPDYTVDANALIREFTGNDSLANAKYTEKIIRVNGQVSDMEQPSDTTVNIKMSDSTTGSYIIFAFQADQMAAARKLKPGDKTSIKGSCSGGTFSRILETEAITFKRCVISN